MYKLLEEYKEAKISTGKMRQLTFFAAGSGAFCGTANIWDPCSPQ
jgi:hypothetical protein